jgi:hypothetical protein
MITAIDCLARAADMDERAAICDGASDRASFLRVATGWRRAARMARYQDEWSTLDEAAV